MDSSTKIDKIKHIGNYQLLSTLGEGTFGKVRLAIHLLANEKSDYIVPVQSSSKFFMDFLTCMDAPHSLLYDIFESFRVAIKILDKDQLSDLRDRERLSREVRIMKSINHPNIIQLLEVIDTSKHIFIVLENACNGELFDYIVKNGKLSEGDTRSYFQQLASAISYLHRNGIIHRDLKPENLLLDVNYRLKVADFGFSTMIRPGFSLRTFCGSPAYAAPEMITGKEYVGPEVDIWSMGIILFAMLCGYLPFDDPNTSKLYQLINKCEYKCPSHLSSESRTLISRMLVIQPSKRAQMDEILSNCWVNEGGFHIVQGEQDGSQFDEDIIEEMENIGFDGEYSRKSLQDKERNQVTATYWILHAKKFRDLGLAKRSDTFTVEHPKQKRDFGNSRFMPDDEPGDYLPRISPAPKSFSEQEPQSDHYLSKERLPAIVERKTNQIKSSTTDRYLDNHHSLTPFQTRRNTYVTPSPTRDDDSAKLKQRRRYSERVGHNQIPRSVSRNREKIGDSDRESVTDAEFLIRKSPLLVPIDRRTPAQGSAKSRRATPSPSPSRLGGSPSPDIRFIESYHAREVV